MGRPRKSVDDGRDFSNAADMNIALRRADAPLPARHLLPALLAKAKADGDQALIDRILVACSQEW